MTLAFSNETIPPSHTTLVSKLEARSQSQKIVPNGAIIAVTVILGVIFIAFALTVIYWRYMAKLDREERNEHARIELNRRAKKVDSPSSGSGRTHRTAYQPRPEGGNGRSRGKYGEENRWGFWLTNCTLQARPMAMGRPGRHTETQGRLRIGLRRKIWKSTEIIKGIQANEILRMKIIAGIHPISFVVPIVLLSISRRLLRTS